MELSGRVAAVTGAGRGIGLAIAQELVAHGMKVALGDLNEEAVTRAAGDLGDAAIGLPLDVTREESFSGFLDRTEEKLGPLALLVNNAGVMRVGAYAEEDEAVTRRMIEVNLLGVMRGCRLALPRMLPRHEGTLVNIASMAGKSGYASITTYTATKHGVVGFSDALREELRGSGIHVGVILPALVDTHLAAGAASALAKPIAPDEVAEAVVRLVRTGAYEAIVPRWIAGLARPVMALPPRAKAWVSRVTGGNVYSASDAKARADYERWLKDHAG
jgi:NADP-dependent 3-hydroxy acid dehydrogenase YdfG